MNTDLLGNPSTVTTPPPSSKRARSGALERLLHELTAIAFGDKTESSFLDPSQFERWEGDDTTYLEATLESLDLPEIDLSTRDGKVLIRILWQVDDDRDDSLNTGLGQGDSGVYFAS